MQGQCRPADAAARERIEQGLCEVQPGSRRRDGALGASKDCLIIAAIMCITAARALDVGWQRHVAVASERLAERFGREIEAQAQVTLRVLLGDHCGQAVAKDDGVARPQPARALREGAPKAAAKVAVERDLYHRLAS